MPRHVIFDFFGTLVTYRDGVPGNPVARAQAVLRDHGMHIAPDVLAISMASCFDELEGWAMQTLREFSMSDAAGLLYQKLGAPTARVSLNDFVAAYLEDWTGNVEALPGLRAWLDAIDAPKSVLSNTHHEPMVVQLLRRFGIADAFQTLTTSIGHGKRKPHPSIYAAHLDALGIAAGDAVFVGDNPACDYFGPRAAGIDAYLIAPRPVAGVAESHRLEHLFELGEYLAR